MSTEGQDVLVLGIDPAPKKATVVFSREIGFEAWPATEVRERLVERCEGRRALVAWDAPLSFDRTSFSDRAVDRAARAWLAGLPSTDEGRVASALPFSGCPHWAISCHALGLPFRADDSRVTARLVSARDDLIEGVNVIEVHPAVALAVRWFSARADPFPAYKRDSDALVHLVAEVAPELRQRPGWRNDDDHLDAWTAWKLATDFLDGSAEWFGSAASGGYVLPKSRTGLAEGLVLPQGGRGP